MSTIANPGCTGNGVLLAAALALLRHGLALFRIAPGSKQPLAGSHGFKDATADPAVIRRWFATSRCNIGVATGLSHLAVLDGDERHGADLHDLDGLGLPETPSVKSPGGFHLYYRGTVPSGHLDGLPGWEMKSAGAYVLAPPSNRNDGGIYRWQLGLSLDDLAIAELPEPLRVRLRRSSAPRTEATGELLQIPLGVRNAMVYRIGCGLRAKGVDYPALVEMLAALNRFHVTEPLTTRELEKIAASCCERTPGTGLI